MRKRRAAVCLAALLLTVLLAGAAGPLARFIRRGEEALSPPGTGTAKRTLVTVWIAGDVPGAAAWLRAQAAAYSRKNAGVSVWLRSASEADLALLAEQPEAAPDVLAFAASVPVDTETLRACAPLCMSGYALLARTEEAAGTPAPKSLFGVTATPDPRHTPAPTPAADWPESILADDGFGAIALAALGAPSGGELDTADAVLRRFVSGEARAAVLTVQQAQSALAQGAGWQVIAASPATDLVLYGALTAKASGAAEGFLSYLQGEDARRALSERSLLPARAGMRLYGGDRPLLQALEAALSDGWLAPAGRWAEARNDVLSAARALHRAGQRADESLKLCP
ncbi:MAG: hypothetical protein IJS53_04085 [Clostridia bacterium]|nr:hypothetical protein [Clostridia bacterium]